MSAECIDCNDNSRSFVDLNFDKIYDNLHRVLTNSIYNVGALQMKGKTKLQSSSAQYWSRHTDTQS